MQAHPSRNYIPVVISSPNYTSMPSTVATFIATRLMVVLQPSGCYDLRSLGLDKRTTLVLGNTRKLDKELFTK